MESAGNAYVDADHATANVGRVIVAVWRKETTVEAIERIRRRAEEAMRATPGPFGYLGIVEPKASPPSSAARAAIARVFDDLGSRLPCAAMVYEGSGLRGALVRSAVTAILLVTSRTQVKPAVVGTVPEGVGLLASKLEALGGPVDAKSVAEEVARIRLMYARF